MIEKKDSPFSEIKGNKEINNILNYLFNKQMFYEETFNCLEKRFKSVIEMANDKKIENNQSENIYKVDL